MKAVNVIFLALLLSGCVSAGRIAMEDYNSVQVGPMAKIKLTSPYLEPPPMSVYRIAIVVYDLNGNCSFSPKGKIPLSEGKDDKLVFVPANRRNYFALIHKNNTYEGGGAVTSFSHILLFSFVPEDSREYTIEHIDNPGPIRAKYYLNDKVGKKTPIEVNDIGDGFYVDAEHVCRFDKNQLQPN